MQPEVRDDRQMRALTGLSIEKLTVLEEAFEKVLQQKKQQAYEEGLAQGKRRRKVGGGQKGKLPRAHDKLIFSLYYLKVYPTFDVLGTQFGMGRSKACENIHHLLPILNETLASLGVLPHREFKSVEEFRLACHEIEKLLIDVTERIHVRPQDHEQQQALYSGKKKAHNEEYGHFDA